jgi:hypothetical protein
MGGIDMQPGLNFGSAEVTTCSGAAGNGNLATLSYAHEHGWDELTFRNAAENGHLDTELCLGKWVSIMG